MRKFGPYVEGIYKLSFGSEGLESVARLPEIPPDGFDFVALGPPPLNHEYFIKGKSWADIAIFQVRIPASTRIASALERIANALEEKNIPQPALRKTRKRSSPTTSPSQSQPLIATYCEAYKLRYGINPVIDGKTQGQVSQLLKAVPATRLSELLQAYLQMDDPWFKTRCHDFSTFVGNLGKVAISLANGTQDPHEKRYWQKVYGETDGERDLPKAIAPDASDVARKELPRGTGSALLEKLPT